MSMDPVEREKLLENEWKQTPERIVLAEVKGWSHAHIDLAQALDGTWRSGFNLSSRGGGSARGPSVNYGFQHETRQDAFDFEVQHAIRFFQNRLLEADNGCYAADSVRKDAVFILAQIEQRTAPQQLDMFG